MPRRFQRIPSQRQRRKTHWVGGQTTPTTAESVGAAASVIALSFDTRTVGSEPSAPFTIVRIRGQFVAYSDQVAQDEDPFGAIGCMVINGEAFDAGVASIPTPYTESFDNNWFWHSYWSAPVAVSGANSIDIYRDNIIIDSKAMRKVEFGDVWVMLIENKSSAHAMAYTLNMRMLVKVH